VDYAGNRVRIWTGDIEVHINADITHAVLKYYQVTGDRGFLLSCGLPVLVEIAQFWASYVTFDTSKGRYEIRGVIGPDEFHEHIDNNTYTNFLVRWALNRTCDLVETLKQQEPQRMGELLAQAQVADLDLALWRDVARRLHVPVAPQGDLIEQFEGYFGLKEYPIAAHDENGMPLWPEGLDLTALGATTLIKQPDVVMLFALLGEEFSPEVKTLNYEFYEARTMHKSSLSPSMYAMVGLSIGKTEHAYQYFLKAAETDLVDNQGNTSHGIHTANMGGVWQTAVFGFGGLSVSATGQPSVDPWLPKNWTALSYRFVWQGVGIRVRVTPKSVEIVAEEATSLLLGGAEVNLEAGIAVQRPRT
jgi:kojibiose phosphorylase